MVETKKGGLRSFPPLFWLVVVFEFFERGSYYGMMSILSVYLTDILGFAKQDVGLIKGTIQPLLYFLPIITGALADRFGYRRTLLVAFTLLGGGYFLTSQTSTYAAVFLSLCVMGLGAGAFKPVISGTIARVTDESNSTLGFGIFYWSINLGAFLFPLILVPYLKNNIGWTWVIVASAIGTAAMILPTLFFFREPPMGEQKKDAPRPNLVQTLANAFEIIYSPIVLLVRWARSRQGAAVVLAVLGLAFLAVAGWQYAAPRQAVVAAPGTTFAMPAPDAPLEIRVNRNQTVLDPWAVSKTDEDTLLVEFFRPDELPKRQAELLSAIVAEGGPRFEAEQLRDMLMLAATPTRLVLVEDAAARPFAVEATVDGDGDVVYIRAADIEAYDAYRQELLAAVRAVPRLATIPPGSLDTLFGRAASRPFLLLFIAVVVGLAAAVLLLKPRYREASSGSRAGYVVVTLAVALGLVWGLPDLSLFARILSSVIATTVLSLYLIDIRDVERFRDNWRFLLLIFIYSGFWILYFQMFDSVLWYVQAYVDASSLNQVVNGFLGAVGVDLNWRFDIEHVTVINAGTIILLQLLISTLVRKTPALPTMIVGIALGTVGMAILAVSTGIWVFMAGIIIFSIGEMTAHPKLISYIGQTAPRDRVATFMGYVFLYGVIGSSIGGVLGANLYVHYVDRLNQPRTLWLIFSLIGVITIVGLLLYNRLVKPREVAGA